MSIAQLVRDGQEACDVGTSELDFMCVSQHCGRLRIGGTLLQPTRQIQKIKKLRIEASPGIAVASFTGLDVPIEVVTADHGTFQIHPNSGTTLLPLIAPRGVLAALDLAEGFTPAPVINIEAILGLINELRFTDGALTSAAGRPVSASACLALLCRLGVQKNLASTTAMCLKAFDQLGIKVQERESFLEAIRNCMKGRGGRLARDIAVLEKRGYRIRIKQRLSSSCHPHFAEVEGMDDSNLKLSPAKYAIKFAMAA